MTSNDIKNLILKVVSRVRKNKNFQPTKDQKELMKRLFDGTYDRVEFRRQGNFTLAVISSSTSKSPVLYGMSKRNAMTDIDNVEQGMSVAVSAAVRTAAGEVC